MSASRVILPFILGVVGLGACSSPPPGDVSEPIPVPPDDPKIEEPDPHLEEPAPIEHRFDAPMDWPTPRFAESDAGLMNAGPLGNAGYWYTFDIDGDRRPELVSFAPSSDGRQHGLGSSPHWLVYENTGTEFSSSPIAWSTPDLGSPNGLNKHGAPRSAVKSDWRTFDIDGDRLPDLVSFVPPGTAVQHGAGTDPHWLVYVNDGSGFTGTPIRWPTPSFPELINGIHDDEHIGRLEGDLGRREGSWSTFDIDGDERPDLVSFCFDFVLGQHGLNTVPHWKVYLNTGAGFAESAIEWKTPALGNPTRGLWAASRDHQNWGYWNTFDISGDGRPDLVSFAPADGSGQYGLGNDPHWLVFENTGDGFSTAPQLWATPPAPAATRGFHMDAHASSTLGHWSTFDIDGDQRADLVHLSPPGYQQYGWEAEPHWRVYRNEGASFSIVPILQSMPTFEMGPNGVYTTAIVTPNNGSWWTFDIDGDTRPDIVNFATSGAQTQFGWPDAPHWRVYRNL